MTRKAVRSRVVQDTKGESKESRSVRPTAVWYEDPLKTLHDRSSATKNATELQEMPTALRVRSYRFFFYAGDRDEPMHIHVERNDKVAKFWLDPVRLQVSGGFSRSEIGRIQKIITTHHSELVEAWNEYFRG